VEVAAFKSAVTTLHAVRKAAARSRVSNGRDVLPDVDGGSLIARRYRDITNSILRDQNPAKPRRRQRGRGDGAGAVVTPALPAAGAEGSGPRGGTRSRPAAAAHVH
jgi:hypothetical protein